MVQFFFCSPCTTFPGKSSPTQTFKILVCLLTDWVAHKSSSKAIAYPLLPGYCYELAHYTRYRVVIAQYFVFLARSEVQQGMWARSEVQRGKARSEVQWVGEWCWPLEKATERSVGASGFMVCSVENPNVRLKGARNWNYPFNMAKVMLKAYVPILLSTIGINCFQLGMLNRINPTKMHSKSRCYLWKFSIILRWCSCRFLIILPVRWLMLFYDIVASTISFWILY